MDLEDRNAVANVDDVILPGFRFHPTDEELVGFYLRRKVQHKALSIELIKQVDIYKYDPWDLPKIASTGEKEWYFYCPRDRKYRNSARPNRVTGAGFWKATGTDRPIYSSEGAKCIGLKKSLVFYRGRAAKGIKTDWMMHEFRLPSLADPSPPKKLLDKSYPANDAWAICRIFKKTNSMAQRALSQSWVSTLQQEGTQSHHIPTHMNTPQNMTFNHNDFQTLEPPLYLVPGADLPFIFAPLETSGTMFMDQQGSESISFSGSQELLNQQQVKNPTCPGDIDNVGQWGTVRSMGFPFSLPEDLPWDSSPQCPSDTYSTNKCYA